jgi:hypothetical protein
MEQMCNPYVIAAWALSPHPDIQTHCRQNMSPKYKVIIRDLLFKLLLEDDLPPANVDQRKGVIANTFWEEWYTFNNRTGDIFGNSNYCWSSQDIVTNKTYRWHKINSLIETKFLGKFACRVTSKIVGIGNAERCWGDVKSLKSGKRAHLSAEAVHKQATVYGSACSQKADMERTRKRPDEEFVMWDDVDMDCLGLDKFGFTKEDLKLSTESVRVVKLYIEDWEKKAILDKDSTNKIRLGTKYGGLKFVEDNVLYTIATDDGDYKTGRKERGWHIIGCKKTFDPHVADKSTYDVFQVGNDLHGLIYSYYQDFPDPNLKLETEDGAVKDDGTWNWQDNEPEPQATKAKAKPKSAPTNNAAAPTKSATAQKTKTSTVNIRAASGRQTTLTESVRSSPRQKTKRQLPSSGRDATANKRGRK